MLVSEPVTSWSIQEAVKSEGVEKERNTQKTVLRRGSRHEYNTRLQADIKGSDLEHDVLRSHTKSFYHQVCIVYY